MILLNSTVFSQKDTLIQITKHQAISAAKELTYCDFLKKSDSLLKVDTTQYKFQLKYKDSIISKKNLYIDILNTNIQHLQKKQTITLYTAIIVVVSILIFKK